MDEKKKQLARDMRQEGLTYKEIAGILKLSLSAVKAFFQQEKLNTAGVSDKEDDSFCKYCSRPLKHSPGKKKKRFCNNRCRTNWWNHNRDWANRKKAYHLICQCCGVEFYSYGNKNRKYCGRDCYHRSRHDRSPAGGEGLP